MAEIDKLVDDACLAEIAKALADALAKVKALQKVSQDRQRIKAAHT
jgi:hypothetical protein